MHAYTRVPKSTHLLECRRHDVTLHMDFFQALEHKLVEGANLPEVLVPDLLHEGALRGYSGVGETERAQSPTALWLGFTRCTWSGIIAMMNEVDARKTSTIARAFAACKDTHFRVSNGVEGHIRAQ